MKRLARPPEYFWRNYLEIMSKYIDLEIWPRKATFDFFKEFTYPQYNVCSTIELTKTLEFSQKRNLSSFILILFATLKAVNSIEEIKTRIQGEKVILYEVIHPSFTVLKPDSTFNFCTMNYEKEFTPFLQKVKQAMQETKSSKVLDLVPDRDDLVYISCLPWVSFTSISHPVNLKPVDSIPRITWGKYYKDHHRVMLPYSIQVHHALVDGFHVGEVFRLVQEFLNSPENIFTC
jgi:chloramphenicol O-acetyltransferase type A